MRDHGRNPETGDVDLWGRNSRLDNLQAAFLDLQFKEYEKVISRRRNIAEIYQERLGSFEQLILPPAPDSEADHFDVFQNYEIEAEQRDELKKYLAEYVWRYNHRNDNIQLHKKLIFAQLEKVYVS